MSTLTDQIDRILPQTQCEQCNYKGCRPYAEAIASGGETIDKCEPGGRETLFKLADLLNQDPKPFVKTVTAKEKPLRIARIVEETCIGCTKCIQACPVDAIIGTGKQMHTILKSECTGCELCIAPCPVDCIEIETVEQLDYDPNKARQRHHARKIRLKDHEKKRFAEKVTRETEQKRRFIAEAVARAKLKRNSKESL